MLKKLTAEIEGKQYIFMGESYYEMLMRIKAIPGRQYRLTEGLVGVWLLPGTLKELQKRLSSLAMFEASEPEATIVALPKPWDAVLGGVTSALKKPTSTDAVLGGRGTEQKLNVKALYPPDPLISL